MALIRVDGRGLWCEAGGFHIDPWRPVDRAVITHAHGDHARWGHRHYLATVQSAGVLQRRIPGLSLQTVDYGQPVEINGVRVSLHPAGHVLGSAQIRVEHRGEVWVVSGDYKLGTDRTCTPFEPVRCHTFITESTFALPIYRWRPDAELFSAIDHWWRGNAADGRNSVLLAYAFGKAQRLLAGVDPSIGPILCHGAVANLNDAYREAGVALPETARATVDAAVAEGGRRRAKTVPPGALVIAPPSAAGTTWLRRFGPISDAFASGWMQLRGARRRRGVDRGFVLSDHADWPELLTAIDASGADRILITHGESATLARWLREHGREAGVLETEYGDEVLEQADGPAASDAPGEPGVPEPAGVRRDDDAPAVGDQGVIAP